jgi:hypothetical protein
LKASTPVIENSAQASSWAMAGIPATPNPMENTTAVAKALARRNRDNADMGFNMCVCSRSFTATSLHNEGHRNQSGIFF